MSFWKRVRKAIDQSDFWLSIYRIPWKKYSLAVAIPLLSTVIQLAAWPVLSPLYFILYFPAVIFVSALGGFSAGLVAITLSITLADYVFMPPEWNFAILPRDLWQLGVFGTVGSVLALLTSFMAQKLWQASATQLQETLGRMTDGFFTLDRQFRYRFINPQIEKLTGIPNRDRLGKSIFEVFPKLIDSEYERRLKAAIFENESQNFEFYYEPWKRWFENRMYPTSAGVSIFVVEVTEKKKSAEDAIAANERLQLMNAELQRSNEELARFAHVASHDMKEPLRMISNYVTLLERSYADQLDDKAKMYIRFATEGATRIHALINDILDYSKVSTGALSTGDVSLNLCAKEAIENLREQIAEAGAEVTVGNLPDVPCNQGHMVRVLQNLIGNAIKFRRKNVKPVVKVNCTEEAGHWVVHVKDNGIGVGDEDREVIFKLFKRGHSQDEYPGSGIGLAICQRIVERHGGVIGVESASEGSEFHFTLPKERLSAGARAAADKQGMERSLH